MIELLPTKATFAPGENVEVEARGGSATLELWRLDEKVGDAVADPVASFGPLPEGGYGVEGGGARTALDVLADPFSRLRYGFVSRYEPGRDVAGVADNVRRLHLNAVQFYDWMYRHAELMPPEDAFVDTMGREVSLSTVRALVEAVRGAGSAPLGYAAVYAAGNEHWEAWRDELLYRADATPWQLGDFLWITDPSNERWLDHLTAELQRALEVGFAGFHLDQYGAPKRAQRADGSVVDLAEAFPVLIERVRAALPDARLIFNNVNDYPTWSTAAAPQDATYIEVWSPHDRLDHLGRLAATARTLAPGRSSVLAAYLSVFDEGDDAARTAMELELATALSHGASCLLFGEEDAVLRHPYYVDHHRMDEASVEVARAYADFAVRYGDLLFDRALADVTQTELGGVNVEVKVDASTDPEPGRLWARVLARPGRRVVSLVDLTGQRDTLWDAPKRTPAPLEGVELSLERPGTVAPRILFASPAAPAAQPLQASFDGRYDTVVVPAFQTWALIWLDG